MNRKILSALIAVMIIISSLTLTSCGEKKEYPVTLGQTVIEKEPEKIVVLTKNLADIISTIGYDVKMVGRSDEVTQKGVQVVPSMGTAHSPSVASMDEVGAEVIFADSTLDPGIKEKLEKKGMDVVILDTASTPKQVSGLYKKIGRVLGGDVTGTQEGREAYAKLSDTLKSVREAANNDSNNIVRTITYLYIDNGVLKTFNQNTWGSTMLGLTGAINVFKTAETDVVDNAALSLSNPDFIFCADKTTQEYIASSKSLKKLNALKTGAVFIIPYDDITMQGNTALTTLETMLRNMYPEDFNS